MLIILFFWIDIVVLIDIFLVILLLIWDVLLNICGISDFFVIENFFILLNIVGLFGVLERNLFVVIKFVWLIFMICIVLELWIVVFLNCIDVVICLFFLCLIILFVILSLNDVFSIFNWLLIGLICCVKILWSLLVLFWLFISKWYLYFDILYLFVWMWIEDFNVLFRCNFWLYLIL